MTTVSMTYPFVHEDTDDREVLLPEDVRRRQALNIIE